MNTETETIVFGGSGQKNPSLMMWSKLNEDAKPLVISRFSYGYSLYALAVSPNGTRIAIGTKRGLLQVHGLTDFKASENSPNIFENYHQPGVLDLTFCTDDILASGGLDGKIKFWSISGKSQLAEIEAHSGGVVALRQMGSLVLASIGRDNVLRAWDIDTLKAEYISDPFELSKIYGFTSLDYSFVSRLLMHPSRNGDLHIYDPCNNFTKRVVHAHEGDFSAVACGSEYVITAGSDTMIKLWPSSMDTDEPIIADSAPCGILTAAWTGTGSILAGYSDGSCQAWEVDGELVPGPRFSDINLRSIIGLPADLVSRNQLKINKQWRDKKLSQTKDLIADSDSRSRIAGIVDELHHRGFSVEAALILADAATSQNKPFWELECRLALVDGLGNSKVALPSLCALGKLLRKLKEPKLAQDYFEKIRQIDHGYPDVNKQIESSRSEPLMHLSPAKDVRGDLLKKGQFIHELEKSTILNKKFSWQVVVKMGKALISDTHLDNQEVTDSVSKAIEKSESEASSVGLREVLLFFDKKLKDITWVYVLRGKEGSPIAFALEISSTTRGSKFTPYEIFDTKQLNIPAEISAKEHNQQVEDAWKEFCSSSDDTNNWLNNVSNVSIESIEQLIKGKSGGESRIF